MYKKVLTNHIFIVVNLYILITVNYVVGIKIYVLNYIIADKWSIIYAMYIRIKYIDSGMYKY